jgi:hypothetical protein
VIKKRGKETKGNSSCKVEGKEYWEGMKKETSEDNGNPDNHMRVVQEQVHSQDADEQQQRPAPQSNPAQEYGGSGSESGSGNGKDDR